MKNKTLLGLFVWLIASSLSIHSFGQGITTPRTPSPAAKITQTIGISIVSVSYSRPALKGREVWGTLVPYGWNKQAFGAGNEAPWRAGANENTVIEFSHPAKIAGKNVPAGKYGLFFVINKDDSGEIILSKNHRSWGSFWYDALHDQLRAKIQIRSIPSVEVLTYDFVNLTKNSAELVLNWEKKQFPVVIEFPVDELVIANAIEELKGPVGFNAQGYASAANYTLQNKINLERGLAWIDQALGQVTNFANLNIKSGILKELGRAAEAEKIVSDAITGATEAELNAYGYQLLGQNQTAKAIEILTLNTQRYPKSANAWDSLGEACVTKGDNANAIKHFKKSLSLNPSAGTKANSEKFLKQLGAN